MNSSIEIQTPHDDKVLATCKVSLIIWKTFPPFLLLFGTVGNVLAIIVLAKRSVLSSTTSLYLIALAVADLLVLYSGLLRQWMVFTFDIDVRTLSNAGCKVNTWLVYASLDLSAWILIAVTVERVISTWFPHRAKTVCTRKVAMVVVSIMALFVLCLNAHFLYGLKLSYTNDVHGFFNQKKGMCLAVNKEYHDFFTATWPWMDMCVFCVIPSTVVVVGNSLVLVKIIQSRRKATSIIRPSCHNDITPNTTTQARGIHLPITLMLLTLNGVFLFSTLPVSIYLISHDHLTEGDIWWAVANMLMYTNNSVNFMLYCMCGSRFRREIVRLVHKMVSVFKRQHTRAGNSNQVPNVRTLAMMPPAMIQTPLVSQGRS